MVPPPENVEAVTVLATDIFVDSRVPDTELNVRLDPVFAATYPVEDPEYSTLHVVSEDSSETAIRFAFEAVVAVPVRGPSNPVAVTTPLATIPNRAVMRPTESTLVTSSYVNVPPIDTLPDTVSDVKVPTDVIVGCAA